MYATQPPGVTGISPVIGAAVPESCQIGFWCGDSRPVFLGYCIAKILWSFTTHLSDHVSGVASIAGCSLSAARDSRVGGQRRRESGYVDADYRSYRGAATLDAASESVARDDSVSDITGPACATSHSAPGVAPAANTGSRGRPAIGFVPWGAVRRVSLTCSYVGPSTDHQPIGRMSVSCDELPGRRPFQFGLAFWCAGAPSTVYRVGGGAGLGSARHLRSGWRSWRGRQRCSFSKMPAWCHRTWLFYINMQSACIGNAIFCVWLRLSTITRRCPASFVRRHILQLWTSNDPRLVWVVPVWILFTRALSVLVVRCVARGHPVGNQPMSSRTAGLLRCRYELACI